jgi:hypothetical protein
VPSPPPEANSGFHSLGHPLSVLLRSLLGKENSPRALLGLVLVYSRSELGIIAPSEWPPAGSRPVKDQGIARAIDIQGFLLHRYEEKQEGYLNPDRATP